MVVCFQKGSTSPGCLAEFDKSHIYPSESCNSPSPMALSQGKPEVKGWTLEVIARSLQGRASWAYEQYNCKGPRAQKGTELGFMLCSFHTKILLPLSLYFLSEVRWDNKHAHEQISHSQYAHLPVLGSPFKYSVCSAPCTQNSSGPMTPGSLEMLKVNPRCIYYI